MVRKQNDAKLLFEYKPNPSQEDIKDLVSWLYDLVQNVHKELLKNFHKPIETVKKNIFL